MCALYVHGAQACASVVWQMRAFHHSAEHLDAALLVQMKLLENLDLD